MELLFKFAVLAIVITSTACTTFLPKLTDELKGEIATVRVISVIHQEELNVQMNASNSAGGAGAAFGAIGAIVGSIADASVNSARSKAAEVKAERFRTTLNDRNTTGAINDTLKESVESIDWAEAHFVTYQDSKEFKTAQLKGEMKQLKDDALIVLYSSYSLTPELESLEITTQLALYKRADEPPKKGLARNREVKKKHRAVYRSGMKYQSKLYGGRFVSSSPEELEKQKAALVAEYDEKIARAQRRNKKELQLRKARALRTLKPRSFIKVEGEVDTQGTAWLADDGALLRQTLEAGVTELGELLVLDLKDPFSPADYKKSKQKFNTVTMGGGKKTKLVRSKTNGWLLGTVESRQHIRLVDGFIYSVDEKDFLRPLNPMRQ